ncbi:30S ribosomal protein S7 [Candidatus Woesearchaeota archaeon]|nr:30S ribosomal protein S7 [Candidatus Woesearchaeota archaeon]
MRANLKLFNRWDISTVEVKDPGIKPYVNIKPIIVPRTGGRNVKTQFHKSKTPIFERLMNKLMVPGHRAKKHKLTSGHATGKSNNVYRIVYDALNIIEKNTKKNPVEVFITALENAAPREEVTAIEYGGARYPQAIEMAPQRRVDVALRQMVQGAYQKTFKSKKKIEEGLAEEIIAAYNLDNKSTAIAKKLEFERQADASR